MMDSHRIKNFKITKFRNVISILLFFALGGYLISFPSIAIATMTPCSNNYFSDVSGPIPINGVGSPNVVNNLKFSDNLNFVIKGPQSVGKNISLALFMDMGWEVESQSQSVSVTQEMLENNSNVNLTVPALKDKGNAQKQYNLDLMVDGNSVCRIASFKFPPLIHKCSIKVSQSRNGKTCFLNSNNSCLMQGISTTFDVTVSNNHSSDLYTKGLRFYSNKSPINSPHVFQTGDHEVLIEGEDRNFDDATCTIKLNIRENCPQSSCDELPPDDSSPGSTYQPFKLCTQIRDATQRAKCETCTGVAPDSTGNPQGVWTAIGCISTKPENMMAHFIRLGVGMGGGISLLMVLIGGFLLTTSQGNPKQQDQAKEMVTSAVIGLLFVLFSVVLLQFIGVTILQIPGFGTVIK